MPWLRARLRGQLVYARANDDGSFRAEKGVVEIRYKPSDGRKYQARPDNLQVADPALLPDSTCAEASAVERDSAPASAAGRPSPARPAARAAAAPQALPADALVAYTDGACSGNPGPAGLGMVLLDGQRRVELSEYLGSATNNVAELTAVLRAVERAADPARPLVIHTDSQYSIGVLTKGWKAKANVELVAKIRAALAQRPGVRVVYVPGHAGVPLNERADELARLAIERRKTQETSA